MSHALAGRASGRGATSHRPLSPVRPDVVTVVATLIADQPSGTRPAHDWDTPPGCTLAREFLPADGRAVRRGCSSASAAPTAILIVGLTALLSCSAGPSSVPGTGPPVAATAPTDVPTTVTAGGPHGCLPPGIQRPYGRDAVGLVTVDPNPLGVTLLWLPNAHSADCTAQLTRLPAPAASRLAHDILSAPAISPGRYNCASDDRAGVVAYLRYAHQPNAEVVDIALSGCAFIDAPARTARSQTTAIRRDLRAVAPSDWLRYLQDR